MRLLFNWFPKAAIHQVLFVHTLWIHLLPHKPSLCCSAEWAVCATPSSFYWVMRPENVSHSQQDYCHVWGLLHWRPAVLLPVWPDWLLQLCVLSAEGREAAVTSGAPRGEAGSSVPTYTQHAAGCKKTNRKELTFNKEEFTFWDDSRAFPILSLPSRCVHKFWFSCPTVSHFASHLMPSGSIVIAA